MTTWAEVQTKPDFQKLNPEQKEAARGQYFNQVVAPKVPKEQLTSVRQQFDKDTLSAAPAEQKSLMGKVSDVVGMAQQLNPVTAMGEAALHAGSTLAALPVEAGASLYKLATAPAGLKAKQAAEASNAVGNALTYQPRTIGGKLATKAAGAVLGLPGEIGEKAQEGVGNLLENKGMPGTAKAAQVAARMAPEVLAAVLAGRGGETLETRARAAAKPAAAAAARDTPLAAAQDYVTSKTGLKWEDLSDGMKSKLKTVARDPAELKKLDPETVKREVRAEKLKLPITFGQAARDVDQLTQESLISKSGKDNPVRATKAAQDTRLHELVDEVRTSTGAKATTREQVGKSVQDEALRKKVEASEANYNKLYKKARETEPNAAVSPQALYDLLEKRPHLQHLDFVKSWLKKAGVKTEEEGPGTQIELSTSIPKALANKGGTGGTHTEIRNVPLHELDDLRSDAAGIASKGGKDGYYAGQIVKAIDDAFEKVPPAAKAWREARDAFKAHKKEFEDQRVVKALADDKTRTDRTVAHEDTVDKIRNSSAEDIRKLKKSLTTGGTPETRAAGEEAWKNIQAGMLDHLSEKAAGRRRKTNENTKQEFNGAFRDAFSELDENGKIDAIFSKEQAAKLRDIYAAVDDVRGEPSDRIHGPSTAANLKADRMHNTLSGLEKLAKMKGGAIAAGAIKQIGEFLRKGEEQRTIARSKGSPTAEAADRSKKARQKEVSAKRGAVRSDRRRENTLKSIRRGAPLVPATLQDQNQQR